jgi:N-acetylneuraminate lyase
MPSIRGLFAALPTPYTADDRISDACTRRLVDHVLAQSVDGFYVGGSTGEALLQSIPERQQMLEAVATATAGRAVLLGHVGALATGDAKTLVKTCRANGYAAVSAIPPVYFPASKASIHRYYSDIAEAADGLPVIVYNIPAMSGVSFKTDDLADLIAIPGVVGLKQTSLDMYQTEQLRRRFPELCLLNGYDEVFLAGMVSGCDGGVGSTYNIQGRRFRALLDLIASGRNREALALQGRINAVIDTLVTAGVFPALKHVLWKQGVIANPACRAPLPPVAPAHYAALDAIVSELAAEK